MILVLETPTLCSKSEAILQVKLIAITVTDLRPNMIVRPSCPYCREMINLVRGMKKLRFSFTQKVVLNIGCHHEIE